MLALCAYTVQRLSWVRFGVSKHSIFLLWWKRAIPILRHAPALDYTTRSIPGTNDAGWGGAKVVVRYHKGRLRQFVVTQFELFPFTFSDANYWPLLQFRCHCVPHSCNVIHKVTVMDAARMHIHTVQCAFHCCAYEQYDLQATRKYIDC